MRPKFNPWCCNKCCGADAELKSTNFSRLQIFPAAPIPTPPFPANKFQLNISNKSEQGTVPSRVTVADYFLDMKETTEKVRLTHHPLPLSPQSGNIVSLSGAPPSPPLLPT